MIYYFFSEDPEKHLIEVTFSIENIHSETLNIQLPAWRPGRYQLQQFARNIQQLTAFDAEGRQITARKYKKDGWAIQTGINKRISIRYTYYAFELNAGSSFAGQDLLYINPVNLCLYVEERMNEPCEISLPNPEHRKIACGLPSRQVGDRLVLAANDFHHLADSPMVISHYLDTLTYYVNEVPFHFQVHGRHNFSRDRLLKDFEAFTRRQVELFGEFPEKDYHFILIIPQTAFYHGVEHRNSTMMVLGPGQDDTDELYTELLGLASHELFHTWNICKIRPVELLPYDYSRENYFSTCFIAEGVTTWYGDRLLYESGVFSETQYLKELETRYKRHFEEADPAAQSLLESSYDLWLDGYEKGIPNRKVSVYHKGAIAAQLLDNLIRKKSGGQKSLDNVMRIMWQRFGKPFKGYSYEDYRTVCEEVYGEDLSAYFIKVIEGNESVLPELNECLAGKGLQVIKDETGVVALSDK